MGKMTFALDRLLIRWEPGTRAHHTNTPGGEWTNEATVPSERHVTTILDVSPAFPSSFIGEKEREDWWSGTILWRRRKSHSWEPVIRVRSLESHRGVSRFRSSITSVGVIIWYTYSFEFAAAAPRPSRVYNIEYLFDAQIPYFSRTLCRWKVSHRVNTVVIVIRSQLCRFRTVTRIGVLGKNPCVQNVLRR